MTIIITYVAGIMPGNSLLSNIILIKVLYNNNRFGDDRLRRERLNPNGEPRGTDLEKSVHKTSANRTNYATLPLAA